MKKATQYTWQVVANDFNSPFVRNYIWTTAPYKFPKLFGIPQWILGISSKNNTIEYLGDMTSWAKANEAVQAKLKEDYLWVDKLIDATNKYGEEFNDWSEKNIFKADLQPLSSKQLVELLNQFADKQATLYAYGIVLPLLDFHSFSYVEGNLEKYLRTKAKTEEEFKKYFELFTQPLHNSFGQDQEEDLLRLIQQFNTKQWATDIKTKSLLEIKKLYPDFYKKLQGHTAKHAWVYYVYMGPAFTEKEFFDFVKDYVVKGINPVEKLKENKEKQEQINREKEKYIKLWKPEKFEKMILMLAGKMIWAKPRRKDYQSKSYYHLEKLMREIARRLTISLNQARSAPFDMIERGLESGKIDVDVVNAVLKSHVTIPEEGGVRILSGKEADTFSTTRIVREKEKELGEMKEIKGATAYVGKVTGIVRIINLPEDMLKMKDGDILVSVATTPSIVPAMKKAAAIVTNEGGLTCHAAIVSRELGIPCVIGTKIATRILKDGMKVEVDAAQGKVTIL